MHGGGVSCGATIAFKPGNNLWCTGWPRRSYISIEGGQRSCWGLLARFSSFSWVSSDSFNSGSGSFNSGSSSSTSGSCNSASCSDSGSSVGWRTAGSDSTREWVSTSVELSMSGDKSWVNITGRKFSGSESSSSEDSSSTSRMAVSCDFFLECDDFSEIIGWGGSHGSNRFLWRTLTFPVPSSALTEYTGESSLIATTSCTFPPNMIEVSLDHHVLTNYVPKLCLLQSVGCHKDHGHKFAYCVLHVS